MYEDKLSVSEKQTSGGHDLGRECGDHRPRAGLEKRAAQFSKFFDLQDQSLQLEAGYFFKRD